MLAEVKAIWDEAEWNHYDELVRTILKEGIGL
jgi:hypothetical protein